MKKLLLLPLIVILLSAWGCGNPSHNADSVMAKQEIAVHKTATRPAKQQPSEIIERKLVKEGRVEFETADLARTRQNILDAVQRYNGYVSRDRTYKSAGRMSNTMIVRIPAADFDRFLADATRDVEKIDSKEIKVKDVTEEFLDIRARLKTKKELEQRYLQLLQKARNVNEILAIEKQLGILRADIESIEGRLKYLQNRVSYATLTLSFYKKIRPAMRWGRKFKDAFKNGWDNFIRFFVLLAYLWPFIVVILLLLLGMKFYQRKNKSKK